MSRHAHPIRAAVMGLMTFVAPLAARAATSSADTPPMPAPAAAFLERALPDGLDGTPSDGRALFGAVLAGPAFLRDTVGPFDVSVYLGGALADEKPARKVLDQAVRTLKPAADLIAARWPAGGGGLISAARLPIVLVDPGASGESYRQILSLLDHCERLGYSGWLPVNELDTPANRGAEVARTWEVQVFNLSHDVIAQRLDDWLDHGIGYYALSFAGFRALRQGSWGMVPPWLANGLTDALDIEAYGKAWVGQESWTAQTPGWFRPGWSGFVPQGSRPPPPVTGPPAELAVTVMKTGDPWLDYDASTARHWKQLAADRDSEAPASFERAAETESFLPRDRAAARCTLSLMLEVAPGEDGSLTQLLDSPVHTPSDGMPDSDALPVIFARAMGGVPDVDRIEALPSRLLLEEAGRTDLIERIEALDAKAMLDLSDHREQSKWLYGQSRFDRNARGKLFNAILEIEYVEQMAEWKALSPHIDRALNDALGAARSFPVRSKDVTKVREAFRAGLAEDLAQESETSGSKSKRSSRSRSRR